MAGENGREEAWPGKVEFMEKFMRAMGTKEFKGVCI